MPRFREVRDGLDVFECLLRPPAQEHLLSRRPGAAYVKRDAPGSSVVRETLVLVDYTALYWRPRAESLSH
jgi:hypothetical protein